LGTSGEQKSGHLDLRYRDFGNEELCRAMVHFLRETRTLKHLGLHRSFFRRDLSIPRLLVHCDLESLDLTDCDLADDTFYTITQDIGTGGYSGLKQLILTFFKQVSVGRWAQLISALPRCSSLERLHLGGELLAESGSEIFELVSEYTGRVNELVLRVADAQTLCSVARGLQVNNSIEKLSLWAPDFDDNFFQHLFRALVANVRLHHLFLSSKGHTTDGQGWAVVAAALEHNQTLEKLDIEGKSLSVDEQKAFTTMLEKNSTLRSVKIPVDEKTQSRIDFYTKLNRLGRRDLLQNVPRKRWVEAVIDADGDLSVLFYWLKKNPALLCDAEKERAVEQTSKKQRTG
jgi:hypothetical protein